jgi:hemerythrin
MNVRALKWSIDHSVFVAEIDDQHREIFDAVHQLEKALTGATSQLEISRLTGHLTSCIAGHFAHEERLMRAARYGSFEWHKQQHNHARKRVRQFVRKIELGDTRAGFELVGYLTSWLHDHTRLPDRMLGAFLRNHERSMFKLTFRAGTKPMSAGTWVTASGEELDPQTGQRRSGPPCEPDH